VPRRNRAKDWDAAEGLIDGKVTVDFTSLDGDAPPTISSSQLVDGWRQGLHPVGSGMWEVWGAYEVPLRRTPAGWKATGLAFFAWHSRRRLASPSPSQVMSTTC